MKYITIGDNNTIQTLDARGDECTEQRIFQFSPRECDYFLNYETVWATYLTDFLFKIGEYRISLPSSVYVYCAADSESSDWVLTDELLGRDFTVLLMDLEFKRWSVETIELIDKSEKLVNMPSTKNILPIAENTGTKCILMSLVDPTRMTKNFDMTDYLII